MAKASATITLFHVVDIKETHRYYLLQSSTATAPSKPTAYPPGGSWVTTEPSYTEGSTNSLYLVDCTVYTDNSFDYTPVSKSSSYEAAKAAYNKAVNAQNSANDAHNIIHNLSGTNILRGTNSVIALTSSSPWSKGQWRSGGGGTGTRSIIPITDSPNANIVQGFEIVGNNDDSNVAQNDIPVIQGEQYTISCYVRGTGTARLQGGDGKYSYSTFNIDTTEWIKLSHTVTIGDTTCSASDNTTNVYFGNRGNTPIEYCGLKMEKGTTATEWAPSPYDYDERAPKYAESKTDAGTAAKTATTTSGNPNIKAGDSVTVKFTNANTALSPTLNVNSMGAKPIMTNGVRYAYWVAGQSVLFTYDGTNWQVASTPVYANTVVVGNSSGNNVYIDNDSVDIRYGSKMLSSFKPDGVYIGSSNVEGVDALAYIRNESVDEGVDMMVMSTEHMMQFTAKGGIYHNIFKDEDLRYAEAHMHMDVWDPLNGAFNGLLSVPAVIIHTEGGDYNSSDGAKMPRYSSTIEANGGAVRFESSGDFKSYIVAYGDGMPNAMTPDFVSEYGYGDVDGLRLYADNNIEIIGSDIYLYGSISINDSVDIYDTLDVLGLTTHHEDIYLNNGKAIRSYDSSGNVHTILHMNASNNILLGYGGYAASLGTTAIYGNDIAINTNNDILLKYKGSTGMSMTYKSDEALYFWRPATDGGATLGTTAVRWNACNANILRTYDTSTTSNGVNARVYNNRIYRYSSSSRRYKDNIESISAKEIDPNKLYDAEVVQFKYKEGYLIDEDKRCDKFIPGFIVEDLEKIYPIAIDYNDDGTPEMWNANIMIPPILKLVQDLKKEIDLLKQTKGE